MSHFEEWRVGLSPESLASVEEHKTKFIEAAERMWAVRDFLGLTQVEAAQRLGCTQANVSKTDARPAVDLARIAAMAGEEYEVVAVLRHKTNGRSLEIKV